MTERPDRSGGPGPGGGSAAHARPALLVLRRARAQAGLVAIVTALVVAGATVLGVCTLLLTTAQDQALAIDPRYAEGWSNRGNVLKDLGRFDDALESYGRALGLAPGMVHTLISRANVLRELGRIDDALALYERAAAHAADRGIILADMKFEFGLDPDGTLVLGDEACTPDSSRFWPADGYEPGHGQPSFDKQFVRDWATQTGWDRLPPAPAIPGEIVAATQARYADAYQRLTGEPLTAWLSRCGAPESS